MELWMTQRPSLYALIDMSKSITPLSDEEIDAAYRVKAREKVLKLAELAYYGTLELELFSNFDIKGSETILALQQRIAEEFIPHIDYDKDDMTAILDIIEDNVHGRHVAWYRYLLCEVHAAAIFENLLHLMSTEPDSVTQLRIHFRQYLLEPGANIDYIMFRSKQQRGDVAIDPLWKLHMFSDTDEATKLENSTI
jgi:Zn-dependent oligopeptidase